jgi:hypothetical protein
MENKIDTKLEKYKDKELNSIAFDSDIKCENNIYHGILSSSWTNLQGQAVNPMGMDLSIINHTKMLCWNHNPNAPIGKVVEIKMDNDYSYVNFELLDSDNSPCADVPSPNFLRKCIENGLKFGISPGYYAIEQRNPTNKDKELFGKNVNVVISKSLPTEISLCIQPANLSAYMNAMNNGFNKTEVINIETIKNSINEEAEVRELVRREILRKRGKIYA